MLSRYSAYFDASNGQIDVLPGCWVCGFVSTDSGWSRFEIDWRLVLAKYGVPYFHMRKFISHKKPFDESRWRSEGYRGGFVSSLVDIIKSSAICSVGCGIWQADFDVINQRYELDRRFNPYAICGRDCAVRSRKFIRESYSRSAPIEYIFDRGDKGRGLLTREMEASKLPSPLFKRSRPDPKLDIDDPAHIQLQAADFAAWEMRREGNRRTGLEKDKSLRRSFKALSQVDHMWMHYRARDIEALCKSAKIGTRT